MATHKEIGFEDVICDHLAAHGWLYQPGDAARYDKARALFPDDLRAWLEETQGKPWAEALARHGEAAILDRLRKDLDRRGTLEVLRRGLDLVGLRAPLALAQFRPAMRMNPDITARYAANRLRIIRQLRYSEASGNSIDLVLFLNGLPVATVELKTDFTQGVEDAVDQYRFARDPRPKGGRPEPLLSFPGGALVHFAVSDSRVMMTTRLAGTETRFLPFDQGNDGGAGNPLNPDGHRTAYLWERIWERESWLEIIGRYMVGMRDAKKQLTGVIFPRFHQLDATRRLRAAVLEEGAGGRYLIQHSAGSGKTNSIAWAAHFLADLHESRDEKVFSSVIVISDRNVIDTQLQEAIQGFERTSGVVEVVVSDKGAKSAQVIEALEGAKKIIVCTIQTFPAVLDRAQNLSMTSGRRFAVIADEAHSSQTGGAAAKLREVLSAEDAAALEDGGEVGTEDLLAAQMVARAATTGVSFIAFTATPKAKTLELFGRRPDPAAPAGPGNLPAPFHVYSMRQAIEEGFILDVLKNYTPYALAFRLAQAGQEMDDQEVERSAAQKALMRWVKLHPYNIAQKVQIVVEHYRTTVMPLLNGKAKAMVVVESRKEAVRWQLAMQKYIAEKGYGLGTLVAFSGEVDDPESGPEPFTERTKTLNLGLKGDIRDSFEGSGFHILIVANKFQTGFDQPLLCGMYVDRRLAGIQAVQTLSRLNRATIIDGITKDTTYILDFANSAEDILAAFRTYYETAELEDVTDPDQVLDLRAKLDGLGFYDDYEVDRVVKAALDPRATHAGLSAAIEPVADRLLKAFRAAREAEGTAQTASDDRAATAARQTQDALILFRADMVAFLRLYAFLSQIFDYGATTIEARAIFYRHLVPLLEFGREREGVDLSKVELTHHKLRAGERADLMLGTGAEKLQPIRESGSGAVQDKEKALLSEVLARMNDLFPGVSDENCLGLLTVVQGELGQNQTLRQQAANNEKSQFANSPHLEAATEEAIISAQGIQNGMVGQLLGSRAMLGELIAIMLESGGLYEALREKTCA